jgi:hypothetical protein
MVFHGYIEHIDILKIDIQTNLSIPFKIYPGPAQTKIVHLAKSNFSATYFNLAPPPIFM